MAICGLVATAFYGNTGLEVYFLEKIRQRILGLEMAHTQGNCVCTHTEY